MCGRYYFKGSTDELQENIPLIQGESLGPPRYNIAPSQHAAVIRATQDGNELTQLTWGLVPHWAKDLKTIKPQINARAETAHEKPFFRDAFRTRRCLIPANGFFEWQRDRDRKQPYCIELTNHETFCFAGLWSRNTHGNAMETFTILTCTPNNLMQQIHHRMPVILHREDYQTWLSGTTAQVQTLLRPYPESEMMAHTISERVNNPRNDDPSLLEAL